VPGVGNDYQLDSEKLLHGVAIRDANGAWQYLPAEKLAKSPADRLTQLFDARETWTRSDLDPYLKPLSTLTFGVDDILLKLTTHSSSMRVNGTTITMYTRKHE
jgi:hypothetical protein